MRVPFIAANWKMFKTVHEGVVFVKEFRSMVKDVTDVEIVVAPPFTAVHAVAEAARNSPVGVAGQDRALGTRGGLYRGDQRGHAAAKREPNTSSSATRSDAGCSATRTRR